MIHYIRKEIDLSNKAKLMGSLLIVLVAVLMCNCGQSTPNTVPVSTGEKEITTGDGSHVENKEEIKTEIENDNVQNSTWLLIAQKIIDTIRFIMIFVIVWLLQYTK